MFVIYYWWPDGISILNWSQKSESAVRKSRGRGAASQNRESREERLDGRVWGKNHRTGYSRSSHWWRASFTKQTDQMCGLSSKYTMYCLIFLVYYSTILLSVCAFYFNEFFVEIEFRLFCPSWASVALSFLQNSSLLLRITKLWGEIMLHYFVIFLKNVNVVDNTITVSVKIYILRLFNSASFAPFILS